MLRSYFVLLLWLVIVAVVAVVVDMFIIITDVCIEICSTFVVVVFFLISWGSCWSFRLVCLGLFYWCDAFSLALMIAPNGHRSPSCSSSSS